MSTMAPWGERDYVDQAADALAREDVDPPETDAEREARESYTAQVAAWRRRLAKLYHMDPELWAELERRTVPQPGTAHMVMRPGVPLSHHQTSDYQMGQHSIVTLFRRNAEEEAKANG